MRRERGFTLVEMLVAMAVSSIVVAALYGSYDVVNKQYTKIRDVSELHQSGRNIMRMIERDVRMAGFAYRDDKGKIIYGKITEPLTIKDSGNKCCDEITVIYDHHEESGSKNTRRRKIRYWVEPYTGSKGTRGRLYKQTDDLAPKIVRRKPEPMADYIEDLQFSGDGPSSGPIAYYSFSGNADDRSGNGNDGLARRVSKTKDKSGQTRKAVGFRGAMNEYVIVNNFPDITNDLSITAWIKPGGRLDMHPIVTKGYVREPYTLWLVGGGGASGGLYFMINWGTNARLDCWSHSSIKVARDWNHVAGVKDSSDNKVKLFVNGVRTAECNYARPIVSNNEPLYIGSSYPGGHEYYRGDMDEICIFNRALSDKEVATISSTHENSCPSDVPSLISINLILRTKNQYGKSKSYKKKTYLGGNYNIDKNDGYRRDEFSSTVLVRNLAL